MVFMTNAELLTFIWKRQTVSGKRGENMITGSLLPFAVNAMLNLTNTGGEVVGRNHKKTNHNPLPSVVSLC